LNQGVLNKPHRKDITETIIKGVATDQIKKGIKEITNKNIYK
jgi:hypothetical protein